MTKTNMLQELTNKGITIYGKMLTADVKRYYNARIKEEKNMKTQNTEAQAIIATQNTENTQEDKNMNNQNTTKKERKTRNNMTTLLEFVVDTWEANYGHVEVASYVAKTSFAALKVAETNRQVIKVVWTNSSVKLAFRIPEAQDVFDNMKVVNYTMPYQITFTEDTPEVRDRILKSFPLAATLDVKKSKKAKKEENAQ